MNWVLFCGLLLGSLIDDVGARVSQAPVVRGAFVQEKRLQGFENPLRSSGTFVAARQYGILWDTIKPFASSLTVTRQRVASKRSDGVVTVYAEGQSAPLSIISHMLFALVSGDLALLQRHFTIKGHGGADWEVVLTSDDPMWSKMVRQVTLRGDIYVHHIVWVDAVGDVSAMTLSDIHTDPLVPAEISRFGQGQ